MIDSKAVHATYKHSISAGLARTYKFTSAGEVEVSAEGMYVTTNTGKRYLDMAGGYGVFSLGHCHPEVLAALIRQAHKMPMSTRAFMNPVTAELSETLCRLLPQDTVWKAFLVNSGTEAVEGALKLAYATTKRTCIVAMNQGFHGKSLGSLSVMGKEAYREPFNGVIHADVRRVPFGDLQAIEAVVDETVAAVILEPVIGEGGIRVPPPNYLRGVRRHCTLTGSLVIYDEIQCGMARTGQMLAFENWQHCAPDMITLGKALSGGFVPCAALVYNELAGAAFQRRPLLHTSTFGGGQLACAVGLTTIEILQRDRLAERAKFIGDELHLKLDDLARTYPHILKEVRGLGLMIGLECQNEGIAGRIIMEAMKRGVILAPALSQQAVIRLEPPLIIEPAHVMTALEVIQDSIIETERAFKL